MDCKTARLLDELRGNRESELPPEDNVALDEHLHSCTDCQRLVAAERRIDTHIAQTMKAVLVPNGLKARILDQLATERGAWYRRRIFAVTAAAAAVILAVGLFAWQPQNRVKLDPNNLIANEDHYVEDANSIVQPWLELHGIQYHPPVPFDSRLLAFHSMTTIQGKQVPMLYYRSERNVFAKVFILKEADFDLGSLPQTYSGSSVYGNQMTILRDKLQPDKIAYVVLFTGDSLDPFLTKFQTG
jgi:hypothetical protein